MSVDAFYSVTRPGIDPAALFRGLCRDAGVDHASLHLAPADFDDVDACVTAFGLARAFTQVTSEVAVDDASADARARLDALPDRPPAEPFESLTLRYEHRRSTAELWPELGKRRRTTIDLTFAVGVDLDRSAIALAVRVDLSRARLGPAELAEVMTWWRARHQRFLDERLALLGERGRFDLDVNAPAVLEGTPAVSITREWGHLLHPTVLIVRPRERLASALGEAMAGLDARHLVVLATGAAARIAALRGWMPPPTRIHGPILFEPLPLDAVDPPPRFRGQATISAGLPHEVADFELLLVCGDPTRLTLAARGGLLPAELRRLERALGVSLTYEHE